MCIHQKGSSNVITTYAFYDNGSSGCFITDDLCDKLKARGVPTQLQLRTMHGSSCTDSQVVRDLVVTDINGQASVDLPKVYTRQEIPVTSQQIPRPEMIRKWSHLRGVADQLPIYRPDLEVGILIGTNCPSALEPIEVVPMKGHGPFATRLRHGWTIYGPLEITGSTTTGEVISNRILVRETEECKEVMSPSSILSLLEQDFSDHRVESYPGERGLSREDERFMEIADQNIRFQDGHYVLPLPFRAENPMMPNNKSQVLKRTLYQKRKMLKDSKFREDYTGFMTKILDRGYAEKVPDERLKTEEGKSWYLPHHGVYQPNKPGKLRVVFDCSAKFMGTSLKDTRMQGPDLTNSLIGVLTRFRGESVAFIADIESMFYQVRVPASQRDFLRFFWWPNADLQEDPEEYQMNVHIFGAVSSPSIANYALKKAGSVSSNQLVRDTIHSNFYVDDCLKSVESSEIATSLVTDLRKQCTEGGFFLTKFISNSYDVMRSIPSSDHSKEMSKRDLDYEGLPIERALGVQWNVESDRIQFSTVMKDKPLTRRGILSVVSSLYDPLGFVAPVILPAKKILQDLCCGPHLGWDEEVPKEIAIKWHKWLATIPRLEEIAIDRCVKPRDFTDVISKQLHAFSDASSSGYGSVVYLRLQNSQGQYHVSFLIGKSRLAPLKATTIPRLELTAAVTSVRLAQMMKRELNEDIPIVYHTDSTCVLRYIASEQQRFPVFVANRVRIIRDFSLLEQWEYVPSELNPADEASRGVSVDVFLRDSHWLQGPAFLTNDETTRSWSTPGATAKEQENGDVEVTDVHVTTADHSEKTITQFMEYFSDWHRLKKAVAVFRKVFKILKDKVASHKPTRDQPLVSSTYRLTTYDFEEAEVAILRWLHGDVFPQEIGELSHIKQPVEGSPRGRGSSSVRRSSSLRSLDPYLENGILRVGGRLGRANLSEYARHPVILPRKNHITSLVIRHEHKKLGHVGRNHVLSNLRQKYWLIGGNSAVRHVIASCVQCRRMRGPVQEQKMADLPTCRMDDTLPPFSYTGVDYFGPFRIKDGRKEVKRYGVIFTCLVSRAVHIEVANTLDTDSFLHALRRFVARRGNVKEMHSDNGTNFVGAEKELRLALQEIDQESICSQLRRMDIRWIFNPPSASHMGGVWERLIRSVRKVLSGLLSEHGTQLDSESFHTLLCEVESIINSRPLTTVSGDVRDMEPLTPNHILTGKTQITVPPPGIFQRSDVYMRRRWRRVQYLASIFWTRWRNEYLLLLQRRQKWTHPKRNIQLDDIVLIRDDNLPRNQWSLGRVVKTESDVKGFVRAVSVKTQFSQFRRPVGKMILLLPREG